MTDDRIKISQEMIFHGSQELKHSGLLRDITDATEIMIAVARIYRAMRRLDKPEFPAKELFIIGGNK